MNIGMWNLKVDSSAVSQLKLNQIINYLLF